MKKLNVSAPGLLIVMLMSVCVWAQQNNFSVIHVPVTYYDFHSDRSNPEFEQPHQGGLRTGAVRATLDSDFKPVAGSNAAANRSVGIAHWFRDWNTYTGGSYGRGKNLAPNYDPASRGFREGYPTAPHGEHWRNEYNWRVVSGRDVRHIGDIALNHDTSFKNIVIRDSLPFLRVGTTSMYEFDRAAFFPLDGRGFHGMGHTWNVELNNQYSHVPPDGLGKNRNYAYTMEMVYPFVARDVNNMVFNFRGDDDVWVFVDNDLVLDLGGIKEQEPGSFTLAGRGIREGGKHTLRVFYVERHSTGSSIRIQTNIVAPPADIKISTSSNPTDGSSYINGGTIPGLTVEEKKTVYAHIFDENGVLQRVPEDYQCDWITWTLTHANGQKETKKGCEIEVTTTVAGNLNIEVTFVDPRNPNEPVTGNAGATFRPLPADALCVIKDSLFNPMEGCVTEAYFATGQNEVTRWIVEVDKYGNYVQHFGSDPRFFKQIEWDILDSRVVDVHRANTSGSKVILTRKLEGEGLETFVTFKGIVHICQDLACLNPVPELRDVRIATGTVGEPGMAIGPNPFVLGSSLQGTLPNNVYDFYRNAIVESGTDKGVLIAVDAPAQLRATPGGKGRKPGFGRVMIYDAVGNVVHVGTLYATVDLAGSRGSARSYAYVWDGKNTKGRNVGPGTYLAAISGTEAETGKAFSPPRRKIGVAAAKK